MEITKGQLDLFLLTRNGEPISMRLREVLAAAADVVDQSVSMENVKKAGELVDRLANGIGDIDLSAEDRTLLKKNARAVVSPFVYNQVYDILEPPKVKEAKGIDLKVVEK